MNRLLFYLLIKPLSFLPLSVLYLLSTVGYYLLYYVLGYRRKVVEENIKRSFPDYSKAEVTRVIKLFYQHLCDLVVESIRMFSMSEAEAVRRCRIRNPELIDQFFDQGKHVVIVGSHYGNWEITSLCFPGQVKHQIGSIYSRLKNAYFNRKLMVSRARYGSELITTDKLSDYYELAHPRPVGLAFIADQSPNYNKTKNYYWTTFLNQETVTAPGAERYAQKYNLPVVYVQILKQRRGYYEIELELVTDDPKSLAPGELTDRHLRCLERLIIRAPQYWLWSHRRWKHRRN